MVVIQRRKKGRKNYYYLRHSTRGRQKERYIGTRMPKDAARLKTDFLWEFYREEWAQQLDRIFEAHKRSRRLPATVIKKGLEAFCVDFTYHTQRIEGSTLTLKDTYYLLVHGITPSRKPQSDMIEAVQHQKVFLEMIRHEKKASVKTCLYWHEKIFGQTEPEIAGRMRRYQIKVAGSKAEFPSWDEVDGMLKEMFSWHHKSRLHCVEQAALMHLRFVSIHPFGDGNGRISRLLLNCILDECSYPMVIIEYKDRPGYYSALERSQTLDEPFYFVRWFVKLYIRKNRRLVSE